MLPDNPPLRNLIKTGIDGPYMKGLIQISDEFIPERLSIYIVPGFLSENIDKSHGTHEVDPDNFDDTWAEKSGADRWYRNGLNISEICDANVFLVNWASKTRFKCLMDVFHDIAGIVFKYLVSLVGVNVVSRIFIFFISSFFKKVRIKTIDNWRDAVKETDSVSCELADICRESIGPNLIIGHSLGGRIGYKVMEKLDCKNTAFISLAAAVSEKELSINANHAFLIENFFSVYDTILAVLYRLGQGDKDYAVGNKKFSRNSIGIKEHNVSSDFRKKRNHWHYASDLEFFLSKSNLFHQAVMMSEASDEI